MSLNLESCSLQEACVAVGGSEKLLTELRESLQDWMKVQPHLPQDLQDEVLESFILGTKMSLEQAKHKLDLFFTMKRPMPEIFAKRDPRGSDLTSLHSHMQIVYLPKLTSEKYRVCIMRPCAKDYSNFNAFDCLKYTAMIEEILAIDNDARSLGSIYIFDHSLATLGFIAKFTPMTLKKGVVALETSARRIKGIFFINPLLLADTMFALSKKILKPKLTERFHVHRKGDYESLYRHIPKSILPKDYGGDELSMAQLAELWRQKVDEKRDWLLDQEKIMVDERLRPGPAVDVDELFGISGSFRKLDVD